MAYYNYHAIAKNLIKKNKLLGYCFVDRYNNISPALLLIFEDSNHHIMPIREYRWAEYLSLLHKDKLLNIEEIL